MTVGPAHPSRRTFLRRALVASAAGVAVPIAAFADRADAAEEGPSPYGPIGDRDGSGVLLPEGFTARIVAVTGQPVADTDYVYRGWPDGAATFSDLTGGWFHTVNHEVGASEGGGVSCLHFDADARIIDAYSILEGTSRNCAGGPTPWGTWLSCEEVADGLVWECAPGRESQGVALPALGVCNHEAVAVDPVRRQLFLTEDRGDGLLYRFTPDEYPGLLSGTLEAARVVDGVVSWVEIPDPSAATGELRYQRAGETTPFRGGEGIWYHNDHVYFTTKGDNGVWDLNVASGALVRVWSGNPGDPGADQLTGVDNITVESGSGDLYVAEDGGNMEIVLITPEGSVAPFLRVEGQPGSELTGPVFTPDGSRFLFSSQRGTNGAGITYLVDGPFRGTAGVVPGPSTSTTADPDDGADPDEGDASTGQTDGSAGTGPDDDTADEAGSGTANPEPTAAPSSDSAPSAKADSTQSDTGDGAGDDGVIGDAPDDDAGSTDRADDDGGDDEPAAGDPVDDSDTSDPADAAAEVAAGDAAADSPQSVDLDPATPDPGTTFTGVVVEQNDNTMAWLAGGVVAAGAAGAGLLAWRRRQERDDTGDDADV